MFFVKTSVSYNKWLMTINWLDLDVTILLLDKHQFHRYFGGKLRHFLIRKRQSFMKLYIIN